VSVTVGWLHEPRTGGYQSGLLRCIPEDEDWEGFIRRNVPGEVSRKLFGLTVGLRAIRSEGL
jgi:hypothetical protein